MATGCSTDKEAALLGNDRELKTERPYNTRQSLTERQNTMCFVNAVKPCFSDIQQTLSTVTSGMEQMGQAWMAQAAHKSPIMNELEANKKNRGENSHK